MKMASRSDNLTIKFGREEVDSIVPYNVALERLKQFAAKYTQNDVYETIQAKNFKRTRKDYPSIEEAANKLSILSNTIHNNINYLAKFLQCKN
ncbi:hypothetical protein WKT22_00963 [Candidatus Lokiarchaeum ossiferum]